MQDHAPTPQPTTATATDKVPIAQKIAYGLGITNDMWGSWLYPSLAWPVFNIFLKVSPPLVSIALMCNRLADVFADPLFGWWSDNTRTRFGRRRPFILVGSIMAGLLLCTLVWVSPGWSFTKLNLLLHWKLNLYFFTWHVDLRHIVVSNYFWYMAVSSSLYICVVACFSIPWNSLGNELTPDYHERTSVFTTRNIIQKIAEVGTFAAATFCTATVWIGATRANVFDRLLLMLSNSVAWFKHVFAAIFTANFHRLGELVHTPFGWTVAADNDKPNILLGAQVYTLILGGLMIVCGAIVFFVVRERYYDGLAAKQKKTGLSEGIWKCLNCRPFRAQIAIALSYGLGTSMVGTLGFYLTVYYVCGGNVTLGGLWNFAMGLAGMLMGFAGIPIYAAIAKAVGKRGAMLAVQLSSIAVFVGTWWLYDPQRHWLQPLAAGLIAFTQGGFWMLYGAMGPDVIDYDELETGKRREGAFTSCGTWIMKVGLALGIGITGVVLWLTGFNADLGAHQIPGALTKIRIAFAVVPIAGLLFSMAALAKFGLTPEKVSEIRRQLEVRRGTV